MEHKISECVTPKRLRGIIVGYQGGAPFFQIKVDDLNVIFYNGISGEGVDVSGYGQDDGDPILRRYTDGYGKFWASAFRVWAYTLNTDEEMDATAGDYVQIRCYEDGERLYAESANADPRVAYALHYWLSFGKHR